jgi:putative ABC transport system ATP-binding protein
VSIDIACGELVALMGPSGSGKSTLLLVAAGILKPDSGQVVVGDVDISRLSSDRRAEVRRHAIGFVSQFGDLVPELSLLDNVALAGELAGQSRREALRVAGDLIDRVGLSAVAGRKQGQVSGGEVQRCALARAMMRQPSVILCDEPTGALDQDTGRQVMDLLCLVRDNGNSAILIGTHDQAVAKRCDRVIRLVDGKVQP